MTMSNPGNRININDVRIRISQCFYKDCFRIFLNSLLEIGQIIRSYKSGRNAIRGQCMRQQIVRSAINGLGSHNVITCTRNILKSIGQSCRTGSNRQPRNTSLKSCNALFEHPLCGICQSAVDITRILQPKAGRCMSRVMKHVRSSLIDRYGPRIGRRIRLFLSHMKLQRLKM